MPPQKLATANLAIERFRILVIGNANAGKTTILKKVCHAQGREPVCFNRDGEPIAAELKPDASRGEHDIEDSFQYPTAHGFIFHDSRGFEAGATGELDNVTDFIKKRAEREELKDRLHAIWYCIPTSNDRPMTEAGKKLFEIDTGNVPVIAIFTKMDGLEERAYNRLAMDGIFDEEKATAEAKATFERNYLQPLKVVKHKPRYTVKLRDMHQEGTNCDELILGTSKALDRKTLKLFSLSILRNDMESRIKDVINQIIIPKAEEARESGSFSNEQAKSLFCDVMYCFPHMLPSFDNLIQDMDKNAVDATRESINMIQVLLLRRRFEEQQQEFQQRRRRREFEFERRRFFEEEDDLHLQQCFKLVLQFMPESQASYQLQAIWIGLVAEAIADICLFTSLSVSHEDFRKAFDFCVNAVSYLKLKSTVEQWQSSITDTNVVLDILKENRDNYKLLVLQ